MKQILFSLFILLCLNVCAQPQANRFDLYFQQENVSQKGNLLRFLLDNKSFLKINSVTAKSKSSNFTVSGYQCMTMNFDVLIAKAKSKLANTYQTTENDLFLKVITKPYFAGTIVFGTNGREASGIYVFKANNRVGWVTMTFNHSTKELEKVDLIIESIKQSK